jgi:hypothetical protein
VTIIIEQEQDQPKPAPAPPRPALSAYADPVAQARLVIDGNGWQ